MAQFFTIMSFVIGVWRSLVSRLVRVQEASGSNPDTPTKKPKSAFAGFGFFFVLGFERAVNALRRQKTCPPEFSEGHLSYYTLLDLTLTWITNKVRFRRYSNATHSFYHKPYNEHKGAV